MVCAKLLLEHKANPNLANDQMSTPLHFVARYPEWLFNLFRRDGYQIAELLIKYRADARAVDDSGATPLFVAYTNRFLKVVYVTFKSRIFCYDSYESLWSQLWIQWTIRNSCYSLCNWKEW